MLFSSRTKHNKNLRGQRLRKLLRLRLRERVPNLMAEDKVNISLFLCSLVKRACAGGLL